MFQSTTKLSQAREITRLKAALQASETRFHTLINQNVDGLLVIDRTGAVRFANPAAQKLLDRDPQNMVENSFDVLAVPDQAGEIDWVRADGQVIVAEMRVVDIEWEGEAALLSSLRDVTERKQIEQALRQSEERLRTVTQNAPNIIMQLDRQGTIVFINRTAPTPQSDVIGTDFCTWTPAVYHLLMRQVLEKVFATGQPQEYNIQRPASDGMMHWYTDQLAPIGGPGEVSGVILTAIDITELKQNEARILHLNRILEAIQGVDQLITREKDRDRLLQGVCDCLINNRGYHNAWIALFEPQSDGFQIAKHAGLNNGFPPLLKRLVEGQQPFCVRQALAEPGVLTINDSLSVSDDCPLVDHYGARRGMIVRLENSGRVYGVLAVSTSREVLLDSKEQSLFDQLAGDIAVALRNIELEQERVQAARERERLIAQLQKALAEVKTLSGLLPICSSCKRIRDQEGDWHEIDTYVRRHTPVEFSHGLCPSCAKRLYPDYFGDSQDQEQ